MNDHIFAEWAPIYRKQGFEPRPIILGSKACKIKGWTKRDSEWSSDALVKMDTKHASHGIGLLMGTPLPGGGTLGAIDVDHNDYVRLTQALLGNPICGRFGSKGAAYFVRVIGSPKNAKLRVKGKFSEQYGQVVECLFDRSICVIPPTIHPDTGKAYHWIGKPLHAVELDLLPTIKL